MLSGIGIRDVSVPLMLCAPCYCTKWLTRGWQPVSPGLTFLTKTLQLILDISGKFCDAFYSVWTTTREYTLPAPVLSVNQKQVAFISLSVWYHIHFNISNHLKSQKSFSETRLTVVDNKVRSNLYYTAIHHIFHAQWVGLSLHEKSQLLTSRNLWVKWPTIKLYIELNYTKMLLTSFGHERRMPKKLV